MSTSTSKTTTTAASTPETPAPKPSTPESAAPTPSTPEGARDVVAAVSYRADGTPDQTPGYVVIGEDLATAKDAEA